MWLFINTLQVKGQCIGQTRQEENAGVEMLTKNILHSSLNAAIVNCVTGCQPSNDPHRKQEMNN